MDCSPESGQKDKHHEHSDDPENRLGRRRQWLGGRFTKVFGKRFKGPRVLLGQRIEVELMLPRLDRSFLLGQVA